MPWPAAGPARRRCACCCSRPGPTRWSLRLLKRRGPQQAQPLRLALPPVLPAHLQAQLQAQAEARQVSLDLVAALR